LYTEDAEKILAINSEIKTGFLAISYYNTLFFLSSLNEQKKINMKIMFSKNESLLFCVK
jgi:hypothetical protein